MDACVILSPISPPSLGLSKRIPSFDNFSNQRRAPHLLKWSPAYICWTIFRIRFYKLLCIKYIYIVFFCVYLINSRLKFYKFISLCYNCNLNTFRSFLFLKWYVKKKNKDDEPPINVINSQMFLFSLRGSDFFYEQRSCWIR